MHNFILKFFLPTYEKLKLATKINLLVHYAKGTLLLSKEALTAYQH